MKRFQISEAEYKREPGNGKGDKGKERKPAAAGADDELRREQRGRDGEEAGDKREQYYRQHRKYEAEGIKGFTESKYGGNYRALTEAREKGMPERLEKAAEAEQVATRAGHQVGV